MNLKGKTVLVTGAGGHLGRELAATLAQSMANLILWDVVDTNSFARELSSQYGIRCIDQRVDLSHTDQFENYLNEAVEQTGGLDVLVNNAAFVGTSNLEGWAVPFEQQTVETWRKAIDVNLTSVFALCQEAYPHLKKNQNGSIINIASIYGILGPNNSLYEGTSMGNPAAYAASKGGVIQLTRWLATSLAPHVRVNALALGGIERGQPESFKNKYEALTPMNRMGTEKDMTGPILFLASEMSGYVTGQVLAVDGGWSIW